MRTRALLITAALLVAGCGEPAGVEEGAGFGPDGPVPRHRGGEAAGSRNFAELINAHAEGLPARLAWAGYWWPFTSNGIASGKAGTGGSPAGKYDAARGGMTRAQSWELKHHGAKVPGVEGWWGHCNGWCVAAALYDEPREPRSVNGIRFEVADQKALLAEVGSYANADYFGERVDRWDSSSRNPTKFEDTVVNQFFLVLTHYMGRGRQTVLIDRYTTSQVWNQPLVAYRFRAPRPDDYLGPSPDAPNVHRMNVEVEIWWADDAVPPGTLTPPFEWRENLWFTRRTLRGELWLDGPVVFDAAGKVARSGDLIVARRGEFIVGGKWSHDSSGSNGHPDFMWVPYGVMKPPRDQDYGNPEIDHEWIERHVLPGIDDPSVRPAPVEDAPADEPTPLPTDIPWPTPFPTVTPTLRPGPEPTSSPRPRPTATFTPVPTPTEDERITR